MKGGQHLDPGAKMGIKVPSAFAFDAASDFFGGEGSESESESESSLEFDELSLLELQKVSSLNTRQWAACALGTCFRFSWDESLRFQGLPLPHDLIKLGPFYLNIVFQYDHVLHSFLEC